MLQESRTMVLTGGTSGIGEALLEQLHAAGHTVIVLARNEAKLAPGLAKKILRNTG